MTSPIWITPAGNIAGPTQEGSVFNFILQATNDAGSPFTYTLISGALPPGLSLNALSGTIYGTIPLLSSGSEYTFTIRATNLDGIADRTFNILVVQDPTTWITASNLGTVINESFLSIKLQANDPGDPGLEYTLISGELPSGASFHSNGFISGYLSPVNSVSQNYTFTVKADGAIPATRTFTITVTSLGVHAPQWNTISAYELGNGLEGGDLGNLFTGEIYSFQLESVKPTPGGPGPITYTLVSGMFPPGISMSSTGLISGTLTSQAVEIYPLIIQITDGLNNVQAVFYMKTNYTSNDELYWVVSENSISINLSTLVANQTEIFSIGTQTYQITKNVGQTTFDQNLINKITSNTNLTLTNSLIVTMNSSGNYTLYQNYNGVTYNSYTLISITASNYIFDLGNISIGQPSVIKTNGISLSQWIRYEIISGNLPSGLFLNVETGDISGSVLPQTLGTYSFRLRIYNYTLYQDLDFSIEVAASSISTNTNKLTSRLFELGKFDWYTLLNINLIPHEDLYREADINFGQNVLPEITIVSELLSTVTKDQIFASLSNIIPTTLTPTNFIYTPVVDETGVVVCEALLLKLKDNFRRSAVSVNIPIQQNPPPNVTKILYPGGLEAIRQTLITNGYATDALENWMNYYFSTVLKDNQFTITGILPDFLIGDKIRFHGQTLPDPFENDINYYIIPLSTNNFRLAATLNDAFAGNYISFNVNESIDRSGTLQFFFPALPMAYVNVGKGSDLAATYNTQENIVPFGYYTASANGFTDVFFTTLNGHNLNTADPIKFWEEPLVSPFAFGQIYYVIVVNATTFKLANSAANANLGNAITITNYVDNFGNAISGSFKKLLLTQNNTVIIDEANTRFSIPVETVFIESRYKLKPFTTTANTFNLPNHGLETTFPIKFVDQLTLPSNLSNETVYYVIYVDENNFQLASSPLLALEGSFIAFSPNFSGLLSIDNAQAVFLNTINTFSFTASYTDSKFISTQTGPLETGYVIQLAQTVTTAFPSPFAVSTNYYVIRLTANTFRLATSLTNAQNNVYITFSSNFSGNIVLGNNYYEYDFNRGGQ